MPGTTLETVQPEIRIAVVEEHEILRSGLVACLAEDRTIDVSATSAAGLVDEDLDLAVVSSAAASSHRFSCPIVVCSDDPQGPRTVAPGNEVAGVVHRGTVTVAQLHATVHAAAAGLRVNPHVDQGDPPEPLDPRAVRLLELLADGCSTREIADRMGYSERTIKKFITGLENRMRARSRAQMVAHAIRRGLI
jgi:DNA-binding NarL/FixJ family response regulator